MSKPDVAWIQGGEILSIPDKSSSMAERTLKILEDNSEGLSSVKPFFDLYRNNAGVRRLRQEADFIVAQVCNFAPEELILASGAVPVRLDMFFGEIGGSDNPLAIDVCCAVRQLGATFANPLDDFDMLVIGATCDGRAKLASGISPQDKVMVLEVPRSKRGEKSMMLWLSQVKGLMGRLEQLTGHRIRKKALLDSIDLLNRRTSIMRAINDLRTMDRPPISGTLAMLVIQAAFVSHPRWWCEHAQRLLDELKNEKKIKGKEPRARLLLTGSSVMWPDYRLLMAISSTGADVVADETCAGSNHLHHPAVVDEKNLGALVSAVAEKTLLPHGCPFFTEYKDRLDRIAGLIKKYSIQGVIHHSFRGCQLFQMDFSRIKSMLDQMSVPCLDIHTELGQGGESALQNRIEAFVEMLSFRSSLPDA